MAVPPRTLAPAPVAVPADWTAGDGTERWRPLELVSRALSGANEPHAEIDWDAHMRTHGRRVVVSLIARGILPERAKELAQDAWMRVIENHRSGKLPRLQLPGVVIKQASFLMHDDRRRGLSRLRFESADGSEQPHRDEREFERQAAARHQLRRIRKMIAGAPPNAQRVFARMYDGEARSAAEIAAELGLSVQRVRQIGCELRKRLREELGPEGGQCG